ncbi:hypothetical protein SCE1572_43290 [Sorangium cellulosum So0157-2]|uniref:Uncharacterized protein n=1 Tax=Sorangium cellulosum So0157-2 TaxID=1254432 RepID=S4YD28_SORCE|nr:hypothetical protein SCE1572_43290 [Sorangium cellulosum So0157-2]
MPREGLRIDAAGDVRSDGAGRHIQRSGWDALSPQRVIGLDGSTLRGGDQSSVM